MEVFLVFAQNVFGLEPATVRVREVRIGRAERRAARRRARERAGESAVNETEQQEEDTNVNVNIGVSVAVNPNSSSTENVYDRSSSPTLVANEHPGAQQDRERERERERQPTPEPAAPSSSSTPPSEELAMLATAQMGPYTTFQQLTFAPNFPLASIADEYIIPPTYPSFVEHKAEHESQQPATVAQSQFSPPGLPVPTPTAPPKWYYRDPKNVVHGESSFCAMLLCHVGSEILMPCLGPWKSSLMQAWYKDGLLPPDLPVRREEDTEYILLRDLRLQSVDPAQPFRVVAPLSESPSANTTASSTSSQKDADPVLLKPISLLSQPRHFGPPALFFSSRGGHSTSIVDARGRSVLKGKFIWSNDDGDATKSPVFGRLGDVKRLEAFDIKDGSVLVAMRQGGLEVVDFGDALLKPADESRTILPYYNPPPSSINRRAPFVWRIGTPLSSSSPTQTISLSHKTNGSALGLSSGKKSSVVSIKNSHQHHTKADLLAGESDIDPQDEVLFLGRKEDEVYFCERNASSFRILRLSPTSHHVHDTH